MALPWLAALKIIPWKDVVEAAPAVVAAAKSLRKTKVSKDAPSAPQTPPQDPDAAVLQLSQQLSDHAARIDALQAMVADLAEHNLRLIDAVDVLRRRTRWLLAGTALALAVALAVGYHLTR
jgi:capsid protein